MDYKFKIWPYGNERDMFFTANWSCLVPTIETLVTTSYGEILCKVGTDPSLYSLQIEVIFNNRIIINAMLRTFREGSLIGFKMTIVNHDKDLFTFEKTSIVDYDFLEYIDIDYMLDTFVEFVTDNFIRDDDEDDSDTSQDEDDLRYREGESPALMEERLALLPLM